MTIEIKGNPGTGNTFIEIHIDHVVNLYTAALPVASMSTLGKDPSSDIISRIDLHFE